MYSETCDERPPTRDLPETGDHRLMSVVIFDIVKYTSDRRPPLLKDHFLWHLGWSLVAGLTAISINSLQPSTGTHYLSWSVHSKKKITFH